MTLPFDLSFLFPAVRAFDTFALLYLLVVGVAQFLLVAAGAFELARHRRATRHVSRQRLLSSPVLPLVSVVAPAYGEEATIVESVTSLLTLRYPRLEVVVVVDGSPDATLERLVAHFELERSEESWRAVLPSAAVVGVWRSPHHPDLVVVDKLNGGKADALNVGLCLAGGELVCAIDADTLVEPDALVRMVTPFVEREGTVAAGGTIRVVNGSTVRSGRVVEQRTPRSFLSGVQSVEYLRAFLFGRLGWNLLGGNLIISGAFGLFRREDLLAAGGYLHGSVGEDMEIVARLRANSADGLPSRVEFVPDPVAWTEVPSTLRVLGRQRDRWHRGLAQTLWAHRRAIGNPRFGVLGVVVYPYFVLVELLAPVVEVLGLLGVLLGLSVGAVSTSFAVAFFCASFGLALLLSVLGVFLDGVGSLRPVPLRETLWLLLWALLEPFGYRQLTVFWRLRGLVGACRGRSEWGAMVRSGFAAPVPAPDLPASRL